MSRRLGHLNSPLNRVYNLFRKKRGYSDISSSINSYSGSFESSVSKSESSVANGVRGDLSGEKITSRNIDDKKYKKDADLKRIGEHFPVYMDLQATTPVDPRVLDAMLPFMIERFGNPHSRTHAYGWEAERAVEIAREEVGRLIGADAREIIFTSGATESNNIALKGVARFYGKSQHRGVGNSVLDKQAQSSASSNCSNSTNELSKRRNHIITTQTEHKCVLDSCRQLEEEEGFEITYLPVDNNGIISVEKLKEAIIPGKTLLVSVMAVNNEIGVIQPLASIGQVCRENGVFFHTDAAQAAGKIELDVEAMNIDLLSLSGHKIYGPKGVGALYVRRRPRVRISALFSGGGQERGIRSGTVPTNLVVGLGRAATLAREELQFDNAHVSALSARLISGIKKHVPAVIRNGDETKSIPGCINLSFSHVEGESLLMALRDVALSSGSACTSASLEPSYVLRALGKDDVLAHSSLRFGMGRFTTANEVDFVIDLVSKQVARLRDLSPLWEMYQEGIDLNTIQWGEDH